MYRKTLLATVTALVLFAGVGARPAKAQVVVGVYPPYARWSIALTTARTTVGRPLMPIGPITALTGPIGRIAIGNALAFPLEIVGCRSMRATRR